MLQNQSKDSYALEIKDLSKTYVNPRSKRKVEALKNVNLQVKQGEFFGLLGHNGAGKSTMIGCIATTVNKTRGSITVAGYNLDTHVTAAKKSIGIVPQELIFDPFFTPLQTLLLRQGLYGITPNKQACLDLLEQFQVADKAHSPMRALSGGMKRRVLMACAMVHAPKVLILDEPTAGVDVQFRQLIWKQLKALNEQGSTIILTTHYLEEAEHLCQRVAIINKGEVLLTEETKGLINRLGSTSMYVKIKESNITLPESIAKYCNKKTANELTFVFHGDTTSGLIIHELCKLNVQIENIKMSHSSLEDVFVDLVHKN